MNPGWDSKYIWKCPAHYEAYLQHVEYKDLYLQIHGFTMETEIEAMFWWRRYVRNNPEVKDWERDF